MTDHEDDLTTTQTEGFKVGEKKTLDEYNQLGKLILTPFSGQIPQSTMISQLTVVFAPRIRQGR